jgi:multiple sugar transport system substrate-binding protein
MESNRLTRRDFLRMGALTAAGAALAACAPPATPQVVKETVVVPEVVKETVVVPGEEVVVTAVPAAPEPVTLRAAMWDSVEVEPMETEILDAFYAEFPHITVNIEFNPEAYDDKLITGLAAGNAPDVFLWWNYPKLVALGGLEDLTAYLEGPRGVDVSMYYPEVLTPARVGHGLYGLPKDFTPRAFFYSKQLFDEAGVPYPTSDWTWDDLVATAKQLTKGEGADAQYGFYNYTGSYPLQGYVWSNKGDFVSPDGKVASGYVDSDATVQAVEWYVNLHIEHHVSPTTMEEATLGGATEMFMNKKLAIFDNGRWPQSQFKSVADLDFGTVLPPKSSYTGELVTVIHQACWCMNPASRYKFDEAWELLKWEASPLAHRVRTVAGWAIPAIPSVVEELGLLNDPIDKTWFEAVPYATVSPCYTRSAVYWQADEDLGVALEKAFLQTLTVADALTEAAPLMDDKLGVMA